MFSKKIQGHMTLRQKLSNRLGTGKLTSSLVFRGPSSIGKKQVALELANRELCLTQNICGHCEACLMFDSSENYNSLPNTLFIEPEGKAGVITVSALREAKNLAGGIFEWISEALGEQHRFVIIDNAHKLHGSTANMLLKILEEPPLGVHFILVSDQFQRIIPTIRSRCEVIRFEPLSQECIETVAQQAGWDKVDLRAMSVLAEGTLKYLNPEYFHKAKEHIELWINIFERKKSISDIPIMKASMLASKDGALSDYYRDILNLILLISNDVIRIQSNYPPRLVMYAESLRAIAHAPFPSKIIYEKTFDSLRNLSRNISGELVLQEIAYLVP